MLPERSVPAYDAAMSFFEPPAPLPGPVSRAVVISPPPWLGPPLNALPGIAPVELVIARTDETVIAFAGIHAYPTGFGFTLCLRLRNVSSREEQQFPYLLDRAPSEATRSPMGSSASVCSSPTVGKPPTLTVPPTTRNRSQIGRCSTSTVVAVVARPGTWSTGCGRCHRPGRSPLCVSGRGETSWSRGPRSTPD